MELPFSGVMKFSFEVFCDKVYGLLEFYGALLRQFRILANFASIEVVFFARPATRSFVTAERMVVVQTQHASL